MTAKPAFKWDDPFLLNEQLTDEERMTCDSARSFARDKLLPRVVKAFRNENFDRDIVRELGALGLLGPTLPEQYGGAGASHVAYGLALAKSSASIPVIVQR